MPRYPGLTISCRAPARNIYPPDQPDATIQLPHVLHCLRQLKNAVGELTAADLGERHPKLAEAYLDAEQLLLRVDA